VTRQQRMGEQSRLSTWPDVNVLSSILHKIFGILNLAVGSSQPSSL
jgi:hypothetical protein